MTWERVGEQWYPEAVERDADHRSLKDRAFLLMQAWLDHSINANGEPVKLKIEFGHGYDGETKRAFCSVVCVTLGSAEPIQFQVDELRWTIDKMRHFYDSPDLMDDPITGDERHRRDLDGFLGALTVGADEAEQLDPKHMN